MGNWGTSPEVTCPRLGAREWGSQGLNPGRLIPRPMLWAVLPHCLPAPARSLLLQPRRAQSQGSQACLVSTGQRHPTASMMTCVLRSTHRPRHILHMDSQSLSQGGRDWPRTRQRRTPPVGSVLRIRHSPHTAQELCHWTQVRHEAARCQAAKPVESRSLNSSRMGVPALPRGRLPETPSTGMQIPHPLTTPWMANLRWLWAQRGSDAKEEKHPPNYQSFLIYRITTRIKISIPSQKIFIIKPEGITKQLLLKKKWEIVGKHKGLFSSHLHLRQVTVQARCSAWQTLLEHAATTQSRTLQFGSHWPPVATGHSKCPSPNGDVP